MSDNRQQSLSVMIEKGRLVISIGVSTLCFAATRGPYFDGLVADRGKEPTITDEDAFAKAIMSELRCEAEDGTTLVHLMLDEAAKEAIEAGCDGIEIPDAVPEDEDDDE